MNKLQNFQLMINDIDQQKETLKEKMSQLKNLEFEINYLHEHSSTDAAALEKLNRINSSFPDGYKKFQEIIINKTKEIEKNLKKLIEEINCRKVKEVNISKTKVAEMNYNQPLSNKKPKALRNYF